MTAITIAKQKSESKLKLSMIAFLMMVTISFAPKAFGETFPVVDTGQVETYDNSAPITAPGEGNPFFGQDAQYNGNQPSYQDNGDGTISDLVTGLTWVQARGEKVSWSSAYLSAENCNVGGYDDWRMPSIKEIYSLILFTGNTGMSIAESTPFIDNNYFEFEYGDESQGERFIDCQDWSSTEYVHFTMNNDSTVFGVNFADGRIKGYPKHSPFSGDPHMLYVRYVRGNSDYGINSFTDNSDETISDNATELMWSKGDSEAGMNWEEALAWVETQNSNSYLGYSDWRLPNAKEMQSILDYSRSPATTDSPAIDPIFETSELDDGEYPWFWTGTTHHDGGHGNDLAKAVYVCFGRATGWMESPPGSGNYRLLDVHGAGAQRSDFKEGDPDDYPNGHGPQGDVVRINNYIRLVRDIGTVSTPEQSDNGGLPGEFRLLDSYPNPFNPSTTVSVSLPETSQLRVSVFNIFGQEVVVLANDKLNAGNYSFVFNGENIASGVYFVHATIPGKSTQMKKITLTK